MLPSPRTKLGFSLVELSIVLVILGLLVGGILSGQSLIRASELRSVSTQYNQYVSAMNAFKDKYFALPGDMANAQSFWGIADADPTTCITTAGTGTQTCNGDGNRIISPSTGSHEIYRFWQHLANAGLVAGAYDGITHGSGACTPTALCSTAANSPTSKLTNSLWNILNWGTSSGASYMFDGLYNHTFELGGMLTDSLPHAPIFRPEELWNIDTKIDDGKPALGKVVVMAYPAGLSTCTTTASNNPATLSADYTLTASEKTCTAFFRQLF